MHLARNVAVIALLVLSSSTAALWVNQAAQAASTNAPMAQSQTGGASVKIAPADRPLLNLPESWVAFEGRVRVFSPDMARVDGRLYRDSNGSSRLETGPPGEPVRTIDIKNLSHDTHYLFMKNTWTSAPMQVPEWGGRRPPLRFADQPNLRRHGYKLSFQRGQEPNVFSEIGFEVYQYLDGGGNLHLQAPALNMFDLVNQSITGKRQEVYDVVLREPDAKLFLPPPAAAVIHESKPRGMKLVPTDQHDHRQHKQ